MCINVELRSNQTIVGGVMTSYWFFKMAAIESEMYFRVQVLWRYLFKKAKICTHTKFRWDGSIHGRDITTFGFGIWTAAILEFYFRFRFRSMYSHGHTILHLRAKFRSNRMIVGGFMTYVSFFQDGDRHGSHTGFHVDNVRPPTKCSCRSQLDPQIWSWSDL